MACTKLSEARIETSIRMRSSSTTSSLAAEALDPCLPVISSILIRPGHIVFSFSRPDRFFFRIRACRATKGICHLFRKPLETGEVAILSSPLCDSPEAIRSALRERCQIARIHLPNLESAFLDEGRDVACHVATFERPLKERLSPLLPPPYSRIRREPMFEENELPIRP